MTCTPDRRIGRKGRALALALSTALSLGLSLAFATEAGHAGEGLAETHVKQAHAALARGDGIAAEMALRKAMAAGLAQEAAAARMGEAWLDQGDLAKARQWLGPGRFTPAEAPHGFRVLGRLEMASGNFPAAGKAFDAALRLTPNDSRLWVDIARLRYAGGEHVQAIAASERAVALDPANVRALEFRGALVRDRFGLTAALPWLEAGLKVKPDDLSLLGEYAATLGELGRTRQMVTVTRRMIELDRRAPRAFVLQAILAARAGNTALARALLVKAGPEVGNVPAVLLLQGVLELQTGNYNLATELLDRLSRFQPRNQTIRLLLARAITASGDRQQVIDTFAGEAARADASAYLLTLVGRAYEDLGQRDKAASLLDRAAQAGARPLVVLAETAPISALAARHADAPGNAAVAASYVLALLNAGQTAQAEAVADRLRAAAPGSLDAHILAGDLRRMRGNLAGAVEAWRMAATVRLGDGLMLRLVDAYIRAGHAAEAEHLVRGVLATNPRNREALRLLSGFAARRGDWGTARRILGYLASTGSANDARVQADLAFAAINDGKAGAARDAAQRAYGLQRASGTASEALGLALKQAEPNAAQALLRKARLNALR